MADTRGKKSLGIHGCGDRPAPRVGERVGGRGNGAVDVLLSVSDGENGAPLHEMVIEETEPDLKSMEPAPVL